MSGISHKPRRYVWAQNVGIARMSADILWHPPAAPPTSGPASGGALERMQQYIDSLPKERNIEELEGHSEQNGHTLCPIGRK
jgi:hypothetical protein